MQNNNDNSKRPVRPQMQGQQPVRPVRPQMQGQRPVRPQQPVRPQMQMNEGYEQTSSVSQQQQYQDINFEDFNSTVVNDTVAENKARGKAVKKVKEKKVLTPEQKKKRLIIFGIAAGVILLAIIMFMVISTLMKKNSQHINTVPNVITQEETQQEVINQGIADDEQPVEESKQEKVVSSIQARECSESNPLDLGEYTYMDLVVNTKAEGDKTYTDKEAKVYVRLSNVVTGYNESSKYIDEYNESNELKNIKIPSSLEYYSQSNGTEMAMLEFELLYPTDFPTSGSSENVFRIPQASIEVYGTQDVDINDLSDENLNTEEFNPADYIVVDDVVYNVSKLTDISVYETDADKGIKIGEPVKFRYITALPVGASSETYGIKLSVDLDTEDLGKDTATYWIKGQSIKASDELTAALDEISKQQETETLDETGEQQEDEQSEQQEDEQTEANTEESKDNTEDSTEE